MRAPLLALLTSLLVPSVATAQSMRATYEVHALGSTLLELEARFELTETTYRIETTLRTRGLAALVASGSTVSHARGGWAGDGAAPAAYVTEGVWRGNPRRLAMQWRDAAPRVIEMVPPDNADEREPVPEALRRGTLDILSALAALSRHVRQAGHCDLAAPIFDGRRRSDIATRSEGRELVRPWRNAWHGEALRCGYEGRLVAGFRHDQDRAQAAEPQRGTAWIAAPYAGAPPVPVRIDIPTRWFGTATAVLLGAEPVQRRAELRR